MTEKLYEELDEAKAEIEKLRSENSVKTDLCDNLKRLNNDQLKRIQELDLKLEKQAQDVEAKTDEVYAAKQSLEDLACKLKEKENIIKSSTSAIDKLRADLNSKLQESEEENRKLVSLLEEANAKISDLEHENRAFMDKIEVLKEGISSVSQKKCASESKMAKASKQMRERGDMFEKLEEEKVKLEEQLKWKNEQFEYLEEAHERLKKNLHTKEKEWDIEKCTFFDDISTLETKLDSHITQSEVLKRRLQMCNQALAREESGRKCLDIQLSELNSRFLETNSKLERLTIEKECVCKEMECKIKNLEEENRELLFSLKELKESQIREAANASSIVKLQNELKTLDHIHTVSEAEWSSRFEKMVAELNSCRIEFESKETRLKEITAELDNHKSLVLQLQNELKSLDHIHTVSEAEWSSRFEKMVEERNSCRIELESKETQLKEITAELDNHNSLVLQLQNELKTSDHIHTVSEAEWSSRFEKMVAELSSCRIELESKETHLKEITTELDTHNSLLLQLTMENVAMKSTLLEARSKINEEKFLLQKEIESREEQLVQTKTEIMSLSELLDTHNSLVLQLTMENVAMKSTLLEARSKIDEENFLLQKEIESREEHLVQTKTEIMSLSELLDSHNSLVLQLTMENVAMKSALLEARSKIDEEKFLLQKEIESREEQLVQTKTEIMDLSELLDKANKEMAECYCDINEVEFELQTWKSVAEKLKVSFEADHQTRKELEASLLAQVANEVNLKEDLQEKERIINDLEEKIKELKQNTRLLLAKENGEFEKDIEIWEQEWVTKELEAAILAQLESERIHEDEKHSLNKLVEEKDERINNLQQIVSSLEEEFDHSTASFSSQLAKMQEEMDLFHEAWENIKTMVVLKEIEVQEKDLMIIELNKDLEKRVEFVKKCLFSVKKLSSENEKLMDIIGGASEWINKLSREDGQVMGSLRSIMLSFDENRGVGKGRLELENRIDPVKENNMVYHQSSPKRRNINMVVESSVDERSPLRTLNS